MRTYATLVRHLDRHDYEYIKYKAKSRRTTLKDLASKCGCSYKQFYLSFRGYEATEIAEKLLELGYELKEVSW